MSGVLRVLVLLPQLPDDPASGAARTVTTIAGLMASAGHEVELIGTTANEGHRRLSSEAAIAHLGTPATQQDGVLGLTRRGVSYSLLDAGGAGIASAMTTLADHYDELVDATVARLRPNLVVTFGGSERDVARQRRLGAAGIHVVFGLYNLRYFNRGFFEHLETVIAPSQFLANRYRTEIGLESTVMPGPLWPDDVIAPARDPTRVLMVNPTLDKGLMVFLAIARLLRDRRPDIGIDVFLGRDGERTTRQAAFLAGLEVGPQFAIHANVSSPTRLYREARVVLVPSLFDDPAPRVVAEALANGVAVIGSDRGGIPEMCADAGLVIPIPRRIDPLAFEAVPEAVARPWADAVVQLFDDSEAWGRASARGRTVSQSYLPPAATRQYERFFRSLSERGAHTEVGGRRRSSPNLPATALP